MEDIREIITRAHGIEHSVTMPDDTTWPDVLDQFIAMLNSPEGYRITGDKLQNWLDTWKAENPDLSKGDLDD